MNRLRKSPGLSLIETAIVLGIVGLVIGGIWIAAAAVSRSQRINDFLGTVSLATAAVRTNFQNVSSYQIPTRMQRFLVAQNIYPDQPFIGSSCGSATASYTEQRLGPNARFAWEFYPVSPTSLNSGLVLHVCSIDTSMCELLVNRLSSYFEPRNIISVTFTVQQQIDAYKSECLTNGGTSMYLHKANPSR